ncbi:MAG TPA: hypothetical protein VFS43_25310 [Polyangiaceae bacterium]|nr:hypothetical protein [Polyangiaceae bacterium]
MKRFFYLLTFVTLSALSAASCSGDDDDDDNPGTSGTGGSGTGGSGTGGSGTGGGGTGGSGTGGSGTGGSGGGGAATMTFFVTSKTNSGNLGGIAGADKQCQDLAAAVGAGAKTWRAYLSAEDGGNGQPVNARDRIGAGPWVNAAGVTIAENLDALHARTGEADDFLDERGAKINGQWTDSPDPNEHDILTGSTAEGRVEAGKHCSNWTSDADDVIAKVGHSDGLGPQQDATPPRNSWQSAHDSAGCSAAALAQRGGAGRFYCFATN